MAGEFKVIVDTAEVSLFEASVSAEVSAIIGPVVSRGARRRALVRTGTLRNSIGWAHRASPHEGGFTEVHAIFYDLFQERPAKQIRRPTRALIDAMNEDTPRLL